MEPDSEAFQRILIGHPSAFRQRAQPAAKPGNEKQGGTEKRRKLPSVSADKMAGRRYNNGEKLHCTCGRGRSVTSNAVTTKECVVGQDWGLVSTWPSVCHIRLGTRVEAHEVKPARVNISLPSPVFTT
ncbi:hypothetical protein PoB_000336900 [Plakobranchus ocellatus]|uniref:Uncharacterized protein n=1 Tax=Plakobranchus ocellatus TaxID=259542 RepID=A0AAV3Y3R7_9GAST|nr:hypothetical protein PoB_000336900 [Plakobranchus ocellatus]